MGIRKLIAGYGKEIIVIIGLIAIIISGCSNLMPKKYLLKELYRGKEYFVEKGMKTVFGEELEVKKYIDILSGKEQFSTYTKMKRIEEDNKDKRTSKESVENELIADLRKSSEYYTKEEIEFLLYGLSLYQIEKYLNREFTIVTPFTSNNNRKAPTRSDIVMLKKNISLFNENSNKLKLVYLEQAKSNSLIENNLMYFQVEDELDASYFGIGGFVSDKTLYITRPNKKGNITSFSFEEEIISHELLHQLGYHNEYYKELHITKLDYYTVMDNADPNYINGVLLLPEIDKSFLEMRHREGLVEKLQAEGLIEKYKELYEKIRKNRKHDHASLCVIPKKEYYATIKKYLDKKDSLENCAKSLYQTEKEYFETQQDDVLSAIKERLVEIQTIDEYLNIVYEKMKEWGYKRLNIVQPEKGYNVVYYENGKIKYEGEYKDYLYEGKGKLYYKNGTLWYEGEFSNHMFNGSGKLYSPAGELLFEGNFANNMAINENKPISVKYYSLNGELRKEIRYKDIEYYTDGKKKYEGEYWKDPKRYHSHEYWDGQGKEYYPSGKLKYEGVFYEGRIVSGKAYFENGKLCAEGVFAKSGRSPASVPNKLFSDRDISDSLVLRSGRRYYKSGRLWMEIQEEKKESRYIHPDTGKESNWPYNEGKIFSPTGSLLFSGKIRDEKPCVVGNFIKMELWDEDEQKFSIENGNMYERILN